MVAEEIARMAGFLYAMVMTIIGGYLWYRGKFTRSIGLVILLTTALFGFLIFSPVFPYQFQQLVLLGMRGIGGPVLVAIFGLVIIILLTLIFGRMVCGYLCPVGAVQELAYRIPVPKYEIKGKSLAKGVRALVFLLILMTGYLFSLSIIGLFGIRDFFFLSLTTGFYVFLAVLFLSLFIYRPFCRLICPFGAILSLVARKSFFKIRRTEACIECGKCETVCPSDEAGPQDTKEECYLCGRCREVCPKGALVYRR
jgi:polyferredoxin